MGNPSEIEEEREICIQRLIADHKRAKRNTLLGTILSLTLVTVTGTSFVHDLFYPSSTRSERIVRATKYLGYAAAIGAAMAYTSGQRRRRDDLQEDIFRKVQEQLR